MTLTPRQRAALAMGRMQTPTFAIGQHPVIDRLLERCILIDNDEEHGCIEWTGPVTESGYGRMRVSALGEEKTHRIAFHTAHGWLPKRGGILHRCDNPRCIRPSHLYAGTQRDNVRDAIERGRIARGSRLPQSKLTEADVRRIRRDLRPSREIASRFNVSPKTVDKVRRRQSWRHVA